MNVVRTTLRSLVPSTAAHVRLGYLKKRGRYARRT